MLVRNVIFVHKIFKTYLKPKPMLKPQHQPILNIIYYLKPKPNGRCFWSSSFFKHLKVEEWEEAEEEEEEEEMNRRSGHFSIRTLAST